MKVAGANGGGSIGAGSSGGGGSSARQTLQFEDVDSTYSETTPVYLGSGNNGSPATPTLLPTAVKSLATTTISPHCDHTYGNQLPNQLNASYEPKDEVCEDYIKLEPVEIHFASSRLVFLFETRYRYEIYIQYLFSLLRRDNSDRMIIINHTALD